MAKPLAKIPEPKEKAIDVKRFKEFIEEFKEESDRAAVILGAAKIDLVLYQILEAFFLPSASGKDELLDGEAPLATFSAKINLAYRLGLIDAAFARALHIVRKIRNSFAHEISGCSLTSGSHCDRVKELCLPLKDVAYYREFKEFFFPDDSSPSADFRATLGIIVGRLEYLLLDVRTVKQPRTLEFVNPKWLQEAPPEGHA